MVSLFDRVKILLGIESSMEDETEPVVSQPVEEVQNNELTDYKTYYSILRGEPEPQKQTEAVSVQAIELKHASELKQLKYYIELAKQNKLDSDELNEDLE